jgi:hypothetical protein
MGSARTELMDLRGQVKRLSAPPTTLEGLSERLQRMLRLAQDEANEIRARAEADATQIRGRSEADATALRTRYEKLIAEVDGRRVELEEEHREHMAKGHADLDAKNKAADAERGKLDKASEARRNKVDEDFEIAMSSRRTESMRVLAEQEATSKGEAERRVREATEEAARVRAKVAEEQRVSTAEAERRVREATDGATKTRAQIAEEQRVSTANAERLVREATEEANRRRHEAATEAQARVQDAISESERRVREATEESTKRINDATNRVEALRGLRAQIADQLRTAHSLITNATPAFDALPEEAEVMATGASTPDANAPAKQAQPQPAQQAPARPQPQQAPAQQAQQAQPGGPSVAQTRRTAPVPPPKRPVRDLPTEDLRRQQTTGQR